MSKPVKPSTVLTRAAKWIEEHGLAKGGYWKYANGRQIKDTLSMVEQIDRAVEKGCSACTWGALYIGARSAGDWDDLHPIATEASGFIMQALEKDQWFFVPDWNDQPERTQEEVVQALKDAAKAARKDGK